MFTLRAQLLFSIVITFSHYMLNRRSYRHHIFFYSHHLFPVAGSIIVFIVTIFSHCVLNQCCYRHTFSHDEAPLLFLSSSHCHMTGLNYCFYRHHLFTLRAQSSLLSSLSFYMRGSVIDFIVIIFSHDWA